MSTVSVIIPCYNRASLVGETIENMLRQSLKPYEVIVVDDGSTDDSAAVIASFGDAVHLIQQPNQGPGAARNAGLNAARGEFIQFMDSDDLASRNKLEVQVKALEQTGADFAYGPWVRSIIKDRTIHFSGDVLQPDPIPADKPMLEWFVSGWTLVFQNCLFRRSILDKAGAYRTDLMPSEDSEYFTRILLAGARPVHTPGCLVFYREHGGAQITLSGTTYKQRLKDWTHYLDITGNLLNGRLFTMKPATRMALGALLKTHFEHCAKQQLPALPEGHPYMKLLSSNPAVVFETYALWKRIWKRLLRTPDTNKAFRRIKAGKAQEELVHDMDYKVS